MQDRAGRRRPWERKIPGWAGTLAAMTAGTLIYLAILFTQGGAMCQNFAPLEPAPLRWFAQLPALCRLR